METSARHVRLARRLGTAAVGLAILLVASAVLWLSRLEGHPGVSLGGPPPASPAPPVAGPESPSVQRALIAEPLPLLSPPEAAPTAEPQARSAPYPSRGELDYLSPESLSPRAPRSREAGELDT